MVASVSTQSSDSEMPETTKCGIIALKIPFNLRLLLRPLTTAPRTTRESLRARISRLWLAGFTAKRMISFRSARGLLEVNMARLSKMVTADHSPRKTQSHRTGQARGLHRSKALYIASVALQPTLVLPAPQKCLGRGTEVNVVLVL